MTGGTYACRGAVRKGCATLEGHVETGIVLLLIVGWAFVGGVRAQQVSRVETYVSTDSVVIGERFTLSLVVEHGPNTEVSFPAPAAASAVYGDIEVVNPDPFRRRMRRDGGIVDSIAYEVTTFALDSARVGPLPVRVAVGPDTTLARSPVRTVSVVSVLRPEAERIHGVAPLASFPRPLWTWGLLGLVATTLVAGLGYLWWRRRQPSEARPVPRPLDVDQTPYQAATAWMRQLESYNLSDPDAVEPFYVELSNVVRTYVSRELGVSTFEHTTREVVTRLAERPDVPEAATARLQAVLQLADLVKFAGARPSSDDGEKALREARKALDTIEAAPRSSESRAVDEIASEA